MPLKEQSRQVYKTAINGKEVDMHKLVMQNEMTVAVGNVRVNARGDELGPNGQVIRRREEVSVTSNVPDQRSTRPAPVVEEKVEVKSTPAKTRKNVEDMDPEGNE